MPRLILTRAHLPSKKTKPIANIKAVTRAKLMKSPTGSAAMAPNSITVRAEKGWVLRCCTTLVFVTWATWWRHLSFSWEQIKQINGNGTMTFFFNWCRWLYLLRPLSWNKGGTTAWSIFPESAEVQSHRCRAASPHRTWVKHGNWWDPTDKLVKSYSNNTDLQRYCTAADLHLNLN